MISVLKYYAIIEYIFWPRSMSFFFFLLIAFLMPKPVQCDNGSVLSLFWSLWLVLQLMYAFRTWTKFITSPSDLLTVQREYLGTRLLLFDKRSELWFQDPTFYGFIAQKTRLGCRENAWITRLMARYLLFLFRCHDSLFLFSQLPAWSVYALRR